MPSPEGRTAGAWRSGDENSLIARNVARLARRCAPLLLRAGIEPDSFRIVLTARLLLDQRGRPGSTSAERGRAALGPVLAVVLFWLAGMAPGTLALLGLPPGLWMAGAQAMNMGLVGMLLFVHYGHVLIDPTDIGVLASRPISERTLFATRLAHIGVHLAILEAVFCFWPMFLGAFAYPLWILWPLFPLCAFLATALALGMMGLLYALVLRVLGPRLFRRATLWLQIAATVTLTSGGALAGQLAGVLTARVGAAQQGSVAWWLPPMHYGGLFELALGDRSARQWGLAGLAIALPLLALMASLVLASRTFLAGIAGGSSNDRALPRGWPAGMLRRLAESLCASTEERAGCVHAFGQCARDRIFMGAVWPSLFSTAMPLVIVGLMLHSLPTASSAALAAAPYLASIGMLAVAEGARVCEKPAAAELLRGLPIGRPSRFLAGALAAIFVRTVLPVMLLVAFVQLLTLGPAAIVDVLVGGLVTLALGLTALVRMRLAIPFSQMLQIGDVRWGNLPIVMGSLTYAGVATVLHGLAWWLLPPWLRIALLLCIAPLALRLVRRSWARLREIEPEPLD